MDKNFSPVTYLKYLRKYACGVKAIQIFPISYGLTVFQWKV